MSRGCRRIRSVWLGIGRGVKTSGPTSSSTVLSFYSLSCEFCKDVMAVAGMHVCTWCVWACVCVFVCVIERKSERIITQSAFFSMHSLDSHKICSFHVFPVCFLCHTHIHVFIKGILNSQIQIIPGSRLQVCGQGSLCQSIIIGSYSYTEQTCTFGYSRTTNWGKSNPGHV